MANGDQPFEVDLILRERTIGRLLTELNQLHSNQKCNCPAQHGGIDLFDPAVAAFVRGALNGGHPQVDLRKCAFWLGTPMQDGPGPYGPQLSEQNAAECLPAGVICIVARAGGAPPLLLRVAEGN